MAFSASVHALGGYVFYPYVAGDVERFHIVHRADLRALIEHVVLLRAACGAVVTGDDSLRLQQVEEFPQGAELCPWCCVKVIGKRDADEVAS